MMEKVTLMCPCLFGLESVLSFEVKKLGGENIVVTDGRVTFDGDLSMVASRARRNCDRELSGGDIH